jgi:exopolyphosphatase/guanosine-5'-triphosphate,3'-diphosphate pyrophosphatase
VVPALEKLARPDNLLRAMQWGLAIRLCQRLSGGAAGPLAGSSLSLQGDHILLYLDELYSDLAGEIVERRLKQIGQTMNRPVHLQIGPAQ